MTGEQSQYTYKWCIGSDDSYYWECNIGNTEVYCTDQEGNNQDVQIDQTAGSFNAPLTFQNPHNELATSISFNIAQSRNTCITSVTINLESVSSGVSISANGQNFTSISTGDNTLSLSLPRLWNDDFNITISLPQSCSVKIKSISITTGTYLGVTVAGIPVVGGNTNDILGDGDGGTGSVSFDQSTNTLSLDRATITGSIVKTANEVGDQLIINLVGTNTVNGQISFQSEDRMYPGDLTFTGNGSLNIASNDEHGVFDEVSSVNTGEGLYIATDSPDPQCYNGYYINGTNVNDNSVKSLTVSTSVTYPIWVYNTSTTHYTQLTAAASTFTTPSANVDENHDGSVSFSDNTLTLTNFLCKTTENSDFVFFVGKSLQNLTVNLVGESSIHQNGFHYARLQETEEKPTLTFTTSNNGKLTFEGEPSFWNVTVNYKNGLGFYANVISTDWPRLQIGNKFVKGDEKPVEGYSNVSFDDETNTLTLGGVTIGTQNSTNTDITVYIKDLNVEISGTNTVYGRFYGLYEENGYRAGKITFKKKSGAETANLTVSGLGDDHGPVSNFVSSTLGEGLFISGIDTEDEQVPTLSYQNGEYYSLTGNMAKTVTISENEPDVMLWIGETPVTSANAENVYADHPTLDGKVSYNNNILSLYDVTIEGKIVSNVGTLTIDLTGSNSISSISATGNATALAFTGKGTLTLENNDGVISGFSSVNFNSFNLLSNSSPGIHYDENSKSLVNYINDAAGEVMLTKTDVYPLWVGAVQVTGESVTGTDITQNDVNNSEWGVTFTPSTNTLLLKNVFISISQDHQPAIISGLDNLNIQIEGRNNISNTGSYGGYTALSTKSSAALTITAVNDGQLNTANGSSSYAANPFHGFQSVTLDGDLIYIAGSGSQFIRNLGDPVISLSSGNKLTLSSPHNDYGSNYVSYYYTLDFADSDENDVSTPILLSEEGPTISEACNVTAYISYEYKGNEYHNYEYGTLKKAGEDNPAIGKYFKVADKTIVFNNSTKGSELKASDLNLSPTTDNEGVSIQAIINAYNSDVIPYDEANGKYTIAGIGSCNVEARLSVNDESSTQVLNPADGEVIIVSGEVTVIPDKPTIEKDTEHNYLNTDKITITRVSVDGNNLPIFYTWSDNVNVETYQQYVEGGSVSIYNPEEKITAQTGTLRAWVGYSAGDNYYYNSGVVSEGFSVNTDISEYTVQGLATSATYTGAAIVPEFSVKSSADAEASLTANTDYTVNYYAVENGEVGTTPLEMKNVGNYKIVITGTGNYGGEIVKDFTINKGDLSSVTIDAIDDQTYTGSAIEPTVTVTLNGEAVSTDDYDIAYSDNINVSTDTNKATITLTAKSTSEHFTEGTTKTATFNIVAKSITNDMILAIADQTYSFGSAITPAITVKDGETTLTLATTADDTGDYSVAYSNNTNAAKSTDDVAPTVTITGKGNYTGTASKTFTINPMEVATATISLSDAPLTYNGTAQHPTISSIVVENGDGSKLEFSSSDYTVSYKQNENTITADNIINVGEYILIASFGGNYSGTTTKTFNIAARDLSDAAIIATIPDQTYTGNEIKPEPEVSIVLINGTDATTLTKDIDFEFSYANNIAAANSTDTNAPTVTITGKGNYTGSASANFTINNATMAVPAEGYSNTYDGKAHGITVTKPEGATVMYGTKKGTYNLEESPTYTNAGSYWVHYQATQANYSTVADSALVKITARSLADAIIGDITAITYTGNEIEPTPTVSVMLTEGATEATVLRVNTDFTYSYKNNTNVPAEDATSENLPTVTITGKGNYTGSTSTTFTINKAAATITKTPTANTLTFNGEQQELITAGECSGGTMQYKLSSEETWSENVPKASAQGTYTVMYQVAGDQNHTSIEASDETKIEVTIAASNITNATVTLSQTEFTYNGTEQKPTVTSVTIPATGGDTGSNSVTLTENDYEVSSYSEGCTNIGTYTVTVTLKGNYSGTATANFNITARSLTDATIGEITAITYTGNEIEPTPTVSVMLTEGATEATVLVAGTDFTYSYKNNTNVPAEGATNENLPTVTITGKGNYTGSASTTFTINKAAATISKTPTANTLTFNGEQQELITAGECSGGTMQYKLSTDETWSANVPKAKDAGKYTVEYKITGDQNHLDSETESIVVTINDRTIDPAEDIEFSDGQSYASFYSADEDLALPEEGIAVFLITGLDGNTLTTQAVTYIPKGVPVLVMKASGTTQAIDPSEVSNNMLHYATSDVTADGTTYILYNGEYVRATGTIPAGKCYLKLNKPSGARALAIGNGTTGIDRLDNTIWATDNWFDLNGRRIEKPTKKGLYIKNGKKVVVK